MNVKVICHLCLSRKKLELLFGAYAWTKDHIAIRHGSYATELIRIAANATLLISHLN